jgi:hypothetical protein
MATKAELKKLTQGWAIVEEDLEELEALRRDLQAKADKAYDDGRTFMY